MKFQFSGAFYKLLFESSTDGMLLADLETKKFCLANRAICRMLGYSAEEINNLGVPDIHFKEDLPEVMDRFVRYSKGKIGHSISTEGLRIKRKNGSVFYVDIGASRIKLAGRTYVFGVFRNVTDRKRAETELEMTNIATRNLAEDFQVEKESLAQAKAKSEALLKSIGEGVIATDQTGKIILINHTTEKLLGWNSKQVEGKLLSEVRLIMDEKGKMIPEEKCPLFSALRGETFANDLSYLYVRKDGVKLPVALTVTPVEVSGKIIGAVEVFRDISKENEVEKLRTDFLALASHQLRTPLSGTKWLIETMNRGIMGQVTKKQKEYFDQIYQLNEWMIQLVSEMLNVLRLKGEGELIKNEKIAVSKFCTDLSDPMLAIAKSQGVILRCAHNDYLDVTMRTDRVILKTILECFISNAIYYSRSGQEIIIDAKEEPAGVVFSIKDSGLGIPKKEQKRIFERFYRASNAKEFKPAGTGLGLSIAEMLAEKIGANISFESKENKGSTFYLHILKKSGKKS